MRQWHGKVIHVTDKDVFRLAEVRGAVVNGEAVRLRVAARLSIGEVALACGVDHSTVWRWEHQKRLPRGEGALRYADLIESLRGRLSDERESA